MVIKSKGASSIAARHLWIMKLGIVPRVRGDIKLFPMTQGKEEQKKDTIELTSSSALQNEHKCYQISV